MKTLADIVRTAAADIAAARNLQNELNALLQSPVESSEREAAKNAAISALKRRISAR